MDKSELLDFKHVSNNLKNNEYDEALEHLDSEENRRLYAQIQTIKKVEEQEHTKEVSQLVSNHKDKLTSQLDARVYGPKPLKAIKNNRKEMLRDVAAIAENNLQKGPNSPRGAICTMLKTAATEDQPIVFREAQEELIRGGKL